jgi:hypothetical protein
MSVATFALDADGFRDYSGGTLNILTGTDAIVQGVRSRLQFFLGEWFADESLGVDYWGLVFVKNPNLTLIQSHLRDVIAGSPGITAVHSVSIELDSDTREATITWRATTIDQETVEDVV